MKLAALNNGNRDGVLAVVSRDMTRPCASPNWPPTLQAAPGRLGRGSPQLALVYQRLNDGDCP